MQYAIYELEFRDPFISSSKTFLRRKGIQLMQDDPAGQAYGDVAPLEGFSSESVDDALLQIRKHIRDIEHFFENPAGNSDWNQFADSLHLYPSVRFGLDTVFYDRLSKLKERPLNKHFSIEARHSVSVNYILSGGREKILADMHEAWDSGYRTFKVKGGINFEYELELLTGMRNNFPAVVIRLDVNQAWDLPSAIEHLNLLKDIHLEYCEQPIPSGDMHAFSSLKSATTVPIAADESVRSYEDARLLIENRAVDYLILKPPLIGSYLDIVHIAQEATEHNIPVIFTSVLESGIGRLAIAHLASWLGSRNHAHGLATGQLFNDDILDDGAFIRDGQYILPEKPGLGADPVTNIYYGS